ncbi:hypothetical protein ABT147_33205 [Streptomyces sp. NPDC001868]|uniref:hypothetical protein n=1 Tax=Streptomyces sp. NPDC001868 TaxID=3154401 RepID=UPI003316577A
METADQRAAGTHTGPGAVAAYTAITLAAATVLTALYGPPEQSERAFRFMGVVRDKLDLVKDWLKPCPEPATYEPSSPARSRARQGRR